MLFQTLHFIAGLCPLDFFFFFLIAALTVYPAAWYITKTDANEVVQEAFLKFMLAAPDLDTTERAVAYLRA